MPTVQSSSSSGTAPSKAVLKGGKQLANKQQSEAEPEAPTNSGNKTPTEQPEFVKQALIIIEKKVRNLDKRRQKLEEYKESQRKGATLNEDQLLAVSKYEEVLRTLELSRELEKQFVGLANDTMKQQKKQAKKEQIEREEQLKERLKDTQRYLSVLDTFADDTVRNDFLNETNGAFKLSSEELNLLDEFNKLVEPASLGVKLETAATEFADHLLGLLEAKNKPVATLGLTYAELKKIFDRIIAAPYWTQEPQQPQQEVTESAPVESSQQETEQAELVAQVEAVVITTNTEPVQFTEQPAEQGGVYHHQNTSDDFIIVSSNECSESLDRSKSPMLAQQLTESMIQQEAPQKKTFFTTLNQPDNQTHRDINEFINHCENDGEGFNFLQDSEIMSRQQQQLEQNVESTFQTQQQQDNAFNTFNPTQDLNQNEAHQRDNQFKGRGGQHRDFNASRSYQQRQRFPDDRRSGGNIQQPRSNNAGGQHSRGGQGAPQQYNNGAPRQNNGYRGGVNTGTNGRGAGSAGYYRGVPANGAGGMRTGNGPRNNNYSQQPRGTDAQSPHSQMA